MTLRPDPELLMYEEDAEAVFARLRAQHPELSEAEIWRLATDRMHMQALIEWEPPTTAVH